MTKVAFLDLKAAYQELKADIDAATARVIASGWYIGGPELTAFEDEYARYCEAGHCVGLANGLDALHLSLRALGIGTGDEVILASNSYIATMLAVTMAGATPVLVEPDAATHNLDPAKIAAAITPRTRAIMPTHLYGQPADLDPILQVAREHGLRVIEDAAQAHGARYAGRRLGGHGDVVCWSFYPTKNLGALGDGGAITTNDGDLAERIRRLGNYGTSRRYVSDVQGVNSRLDPLHAAVLRVKLGHLDAWNARRGRIAAFYLDALTDSGLTLPTIANKAESAWHLFVVQHPDRDALQARLAEAGVDTLIHYPIPPHLQGAYADSAIAGLSFPIAERLAQSVLSLPIGPHMTSEQAQMVVDSVMQTKLIRA